MADFAAAENHTQKNCADTFHQKQLVGAASLSLADSVAAANHYQKACAEIVHQKQLAVVAAS